MIKGVVPGLKKTIARFRSIKPRRRFSKISFCKLVDKSISAIQKSSGVISSRIFKSSILNPHKVSKTKISNLSKTVMNNMTELTLIKEINKSKKINLSPKIIERINSLLFINKRKLTKLNIINEILEQNKLIKENTYLTTNKGRRENLIKYFLGLYDEKTIKLTEMEYLFKKITIIFKEEKDLDKLDLSLAFLESSYKDYLRDRYTERRMTRKYD